MTLWFFMSYILVNIFRILTNLFETLIPFFRKTSVIAVATLLPLNLRHDQCEMAAWALGCKRCEVLNNGLQIGACWTVNFANIK